VAKSTEYRGARSTEYGSTSSGSTPYGVPAERVIAHRGVESVEGAAERVNNALSIESRLSLAEIRLLLGQTREFAAEVLSQLLMQGQIRFVRENHVLYVVSSVMQEGAAESGRFSLTTPQGD
jgi:hypothetical protein